MSRRTRALLATWTAVVATSMVTYANADPGTGMIILVRHAERGTAAGPDPSLTDEGKSRAQILAEMLAGAGIRAIFTTGLKRTQETAKPLATSLHIEPEVVSETNALVAALKTHSNETVLVVGHSDTIPEIIKALGGPNVEIGDAEFDAVFVFVPATGAVTRFKYRNR